METETNSKIFRLLDGYDPEAAGERLLPVPTCMTMDLARWVCDACGQKIKYKSVFFHRPNFSKYSSIDYCRRCFERMPGLSDFEAVDTKNVDLYCVRTEFLSIVNIGEVPASERRADGRIKLSESGTQSWLGMIPTIEHAPVDFQSVRRWAAISDLYEIPFLPVDTFLLFDTVGGRVALALINKYGGLVLKIVYQSADDYLGAAGLWGEIKISEEEFFKTLKLVRGQLVGGVCDRDDFIKIIKEFSGYLALSDETALRVIKNYISFEKK